MTTQQHLEPVQPVETPRRRAPSIFLLVLARVARRRPAALLGLVLPLGMLILGLLAMRGQFWPGAIQSSVVEVLGVQASAAPRSASRTMEAMKSLNAEAFWSSLDERMRQSLATQGISGPEGVENMFTQIRTSGNAIKSYNFVARYDMRNGETVSFFVAQRSSPADNVVDVPFLITTNKDGLVTRLE